MTEYAEGREGALAGTSGTLARDAADVQRWLQADGQGRPADEVLAWASRTFRPRIALASSFGVE
ncbi:MAG TPA: hypothetical protein VFV36_06860, partial [Candidatus Methylomirabilis sp.]|nr:hypothetical protein [Candidatus Methylomirabilis sp.]